MKNNDTLVAVAVIGLFALLIGILILGPLATIAALNTLFPALAIPYDFWTWLSALWLGALVSGGLVSAKFSKKS
jgi:hypothetical protein